MNSSYPNEIFTISTIIPGKLYLSGMYPTRSEKILQQYGIDKIVRLGKFPYTSLRPTLTIEIEDFPNEPIDKYLDQCYQFIDDALSNCESVLVHCMAGISRSVTVVTYYLMKKFSLDVENALTYIRKHRSIIRPNDGFIRCLQRKNLILNKINRKI